MSASIVLAGPPGVGKTAVGQAVAHRLGSTAVDLDALVAHRTGRAPADIIRSDGEAAFRGHEVEALRQVQGATVLALGGGTLTTGEGRRAARNKGAVFGLEASKDILRQRLREGGDRPLLANDAALDGLLTERRTSYASVDRRVAADGLPQAVAEHVVQDARTLELIYAQVGSDSTRILVGRELADACAGAVAAEPPTRRVLVVADEGVPEAARARYVGAIEALFPTTVVNVPGGEAVKTWAFLGQLLEQAAAAGCGRQSVVVGIGGGATCDLATLAAHLLGRGARTVLVPSTLLAQVDASVGGKCAINLSAGRNLAGAFHAASDVLVDGALLQSLPPEEMRSGLAELFKIAVVADEALFHTLVREGRASTASIARGIQLKADIVRADPFERDRRRVLNLGHTLGHALESASGFELRHGEAIAIGIAAVARLSAARGWMAESERDRIIRGLEALGLPITAPRAWLEASAPYIGTDKKGSDGGIALIRIHRVAEVDPVWLSLDDARRALVESGGHR